MKEINVIRHMIEDVDEAMAVLFERRMREVRDIAVRKIRTGIPVCDPKREKELIEMNLGYIEDEQFKEYYRMFLESAMEISKKYQRKLYEKCNIVCCEKDGESALAAAEKLLPEAKKITASDYKAVFTSLENGECDCAIVPLYDSEKGLNRDIVELIDYFGFWINGAYTMGKPSQGGEIRFAVVSDNLYTFGFKSQAVTFTVADGKESVETVRSILEAHGVTPYLMEIYGADADSEKLMVYAEFSEKLSLGKGSKALAEIDEEGIGVRVLGTFNEDARL